MRYLKSYKIFESDIDDLENYVQDILRELEEDKGLHVEISRIRKDVEIEPDKFFNKMRTDTYLEVYIRRPSGSENREIPGIVNPQGGYPGNLFFWYEIKDTIIRLTEWYYEYSGRDYTPGINDKIFSDLRKIGIKYESNSPLRFFAGGTEMFIGFYREEDFNEIGDYIRFSNFRLMIKL